MKLGRQLDLFVVRVFGYDGLGDLFQQFDPLPWPSGVWLWWSSERQQEGGAGTGAGAEQEGLVGAAEIANAMQVSERTVFRYLAGA